MEDGAMFRKIHLRPKHVYTLKLSGRGKGGQFVQVFCSVARRNSCKGVFQTPEKETVAQK